MTQVLLTKELILGEVTPVTLPRKHSALDKAKPKIGKEIGDNSTASTSSSNLTNSLKDLTDSFKNVSLNDAAADAVICSNTKIEKIEADAWNGSKGVIKKTSVKDKIVDAADGAICSNTKIENTVGSDAWLKEMQDDSYDEKMLLPTQELLKNAISVEPANNNLETDDIKTFVKAAKRPRGQWIDSNKCYVMSVELYNDITDGNHRLILERYHYRKDSIGIEIDKVFPGCVIYLQEPYEGKTFWRFQAYCSHLECRNYRLVAQSTTPNLFQVFFDKPQPNHRKPVARQLRKYERDQEIEILKTVMPAKHRVDVINEAVKNKPESITAGNYNVPSLEVFQKARSQGLSQQDYDVDDIKDVEAMQTEDKNTNFIAKILNMKKYGVYIHSKSQHTVLNKLHKKRVKDGVPIIRRIDGSGDIARDVTEAKLLLHALTVNVKILQDEKSTPLPLTEQYNTDQTSEAISEWLFNFVAAHRGWYDDPPLLFDFLTSDFSYANFHAIQLAFNSKSLRDYLQLCYTWILHKLKNGDFPEDFWQLVKICMCYVHIMHTFADMCKRHFGKSSSGAQLPESRVILEILAAMIRESNYETLLALFEQLATLLVNEYENDDVHSVVLSVKQITSPVEDRFLDADDNLHVPIDLDTLAENSPNLYKFNPFYMQFQKIVDDIENVFDEDNMVKNTYYNPGFLDKFLKRFVPLIPLWSSILHVDEVEPDDSPLKLLTVYHNQPIENYFGKIKTSLSQQAVQIGKLPVKLGRAITESRKVTNSIISSINYLIPKQRCNSQLPRKKYAKKAAVVESNVSVQHKITEKNRGVVSIAFFGRNIRENYEPIAEENVAEGGQSSEPIPIAEKNAVEGVKNSEPIPIAEENVAEGGQSSEPIPIAVNVEAGAGSIAENSGETFGTSKEQYNKTFKKHNFTYFQMKTITKAANKQKEKQQKPTDQPQQKPADQPQQKPALNNHGLFPDSNVYSNYRGKDVIFASKKKMVLNSSNFRTLNSSLSPEVMKYIINAIAPANYQQEFIQGNCWSFSFVKKIMFIVVFESDDIILCIVDKNSFGVVKSFSQKGSNYFSNFLKCATSKRKWIERLIDNPNITSNKFDIALFIIEHIRQYIESSRLQQSLSSPDAIRMELKGMIITTSENMKKKCLYCGSADIGDWGKCTSCSRWIHAACEGLSLSEFKKSKTFKCSICAQLGAQLS